MSNLAIHGQVDDDSYSATDKVDVYLPSAQEIEEACFQIRQNWDEATEASRRVHKVVWHSPEAEYLALYAHEGQRVFNRKRLSDCKLCDSDYWQYAIGVLDEV
jgi:hypothetical protein